MPRISRRGLTGGQVVLIVVGAIVLGACLIGVLLAAIMLPALGKARNSAQSLKSSVQATQLVQATTIWSDEHEGAAPDSVATLINDGYVSPELLLSPFGPAADGNGDYWISFTLLANDETPGQAIVCYDRAALAAGEPNVAVIRADLSSTMLSAAEVQAGIDVAQGVTTKQ